MRYYATGILGLIDHSRHRWSIKSLLFRRFTAIYSLILASIAFSPVLYFSFRAFAAKNWTPSTRFFRFSRFLTRLWTPTRFLEQKRSGSCDESGPKSGLLTLKSSQTTIATESRVSSASRNKAELKNSSTHSTGISPDRRPFSMSTTGLIFFKKILCKIEFF